MREKIEDDPNPSGPFYKTFLLNLLFICLYFHHIFL
jgi:hypothetical protein